MKHEPVTSSSLASIAYEDGVLEVKFQNGGHYRHTGLTDADVAQLRAAPSIGRHYNQFIKGTFPHERVLPAEGNGQADDSVDAMLARSLAAASMHGGEQ